MKFPSTAFYSERNAFRRECWTMRVTQSGLSFEMHWPAFFFESIQARNAIRMISSSIKTGFVERISRLPEMNSKNGWRLLMRTGNAGAIISPEPDFFSTEILESIPFAWIERLRIDSIGFSFGIRNCFARHDVWIHRPSAYGHCHCWPNDINTTISREHRQMEKKKYIVFE